MLHGLTVVHLAVPESPGEELFRPLTAPARTVPRTYPGAPHRESFDLHRIPVRAATPPTEVDVEMSRPVSPDSSVEGVEVVPSMWRPFMNRFRLLSVCLMNLGNALSDSAAGALIPYMEK